MDTVDTIKLKMKIDRIHAIVSDYCTQDDLKDIENDGVEANVDVRVFNLMEALYPGETIVTQIKKNQEVYKYLKSKKGTGNKGKSDITLFNYFGNESIDVLIENKYDKEKGNPIDEAIGYCNDINSSGKYICRIAIGFNPYDSNSIITKVLSRNGKWEDLNINGKSINGFIGQEILQLVYNHAGVTNFELIKEDEERFTRAEFKRILDSDLPVIFRNMTDIANNHALKISFTVAFISLKVILEKEESKGKPVTDESGKIVVWRNNDISVDTSINALRNVNDIKAAVNAITGATADVELQEKYKYIFQLDENLSFNDLLDKIRATENKNKVSQENSSINKMKAVLDKVKSQTEYHYEFDLFGEVYESLADNKTKSSLGAYFTKRHIIRPLVNMLLKPSDLDELINNGKTLCDPFCGTGGMLTESFKLIKSYCNDKYPDKDTTEVASKIIYGYDIIDLNVSKTKINMTLAEDGYSIIDCRNSLTTLGLCNQSVNKVPIPTHYDYIITNVPYGDGEKEGIVKNLKDVNIVEGTDDRSQIVNRIRLFEKNNNTQKLEYNALIKVVQLLKEKGKAIVIIPDGILENPTYSRMREWLLVQCKIDMIISLPKFAFAPYTKEKTYAMFIQKRSTIDDEQKVEILDDIDKDEKIYVYIVDNDGYANSDKQYETSLTDEQGKPLHNELRTYIDKYGNYNLSIMEQICKSHKEDTIEHFNEWGEKIPGKKYGYIYVRDILKDFYYKTEEEREIDKVYRVNLLPERYFRQTEFEEITLSDLKKFRETLEKDLNKMFGGGENA
ncbi:MAG: N-6 DNA methylase [Lachnospiraceae bacterium]|nr:N-6 DNA methylase [Lachnospiraceae bacterium]